MQTTGVRICKEWKSGAMASWSHATSGISYLGGSHESLNWHGQSVSALGSFFLFLLTYFLSHSETKVYLSQPCILARGN